MTRIDPTGWLSPLQAAKLLDLSPERVRQLLNEGRLEHVVTPLGRLISEDAVAAFAAGRRRAAENVRVAS